MTKLDDYEGLIRDRQWIALSTLPYMVDESERQKLSELVLNAWLRITGSVRFVEDVYVLIKWLKMGAIKENEFAKRLVRVVSEVSHFLEDLYMANILLKIETGLAFPDVGLILVYENPLLVEQGHRQRPLPVPRPIIRKTARAVYESKLAKSVRELELEYVFIRNTGSEDYYVVDWASLGMYAYSSAPQSIVEGHEVADPLFITALVHGIKIRTNPKSGSAIIQHYRDVREVFPLLRYYALHAKELLQHQVIVLPSTMTSTEVTVVTTYLKSAGIEIVETVKIPVDLLISFARVLG